MKTVPVLLLAACAAVLALPSAAGARSLSVTTAGSSTTGDATAKKPAPKPKPTLTVRTSRFGKLIFDARGHVLYAFTRDGGGPSTCYGSCAAAWPPYYQVGKLRAGAGIDTKLLGHVKRANGRWQVTYAGRPLYYWVGDRAPDAIGCQAAYEFGGWWLVVRKNGKVVRP